MAKNKKKRSAEINKSSKNPVSDNLKRIKVGETVMYRTKQLFDKCTVESVNKEANTAKLSNGVTISSFISPNGLLTRIGNTIEGTEILVWDEECEKLFTSFVCRRSMRKAADNLRKLADNPKVPADIIIGITNKLYRIKEKFMLDII